MKKLLFVIVILLLAWSACAPGCPPGKCPTPVKTKPVITEPPATEPVVTEEPTEPPVIITEPPEKPTEPPVVTPWKQPDPTVVIHTVDDKFKNASLPKSGYGPAQSKQEAAAEPTTTVVIFGTLALLVVGAFFLMFMRPTK